MLLIQKKIEVRFGNSLEGLITEKNQVQEITNNEISKILVKSNQCAVNSEQINPWQFVLKRRTLTDLYFDTQERAAIKILWNL